MSAYRVRPRSSIADPELARAATIELPSHLPYSRPEVPQALLDAIATLRAPREPEMPIVLSLMPMPARSQR